jgi:hypothetical protein
MFDPWPAPSPLSTTFAEFQTMHRDGVSAAEIVLTVFMRRQIDNDATSFRQSLHGVVFPLSMPCRTLDLEIWRMKSFRLSFQRNSHRPVASSQSHRSPRNESHVQAGCLIFETTEFSFTRFLNACVSSRFKQGPLSRLSDGRKKHEFLHRRNHLFRRASQQNKTASR